MEEKLVLFKKVRNGKEGKKFDTFFVVTAENETISVNLTNDAKQDIIRSGIDFPLEIVLDDDNYFFTVERYTNPDGIKLEKDVAVIQSFKSIAKANIKSKTFRDIVDARRDMGEVPMPE